MFNQTVPAPVDQDELALALKPFGSSRMLPKAAYVDPEVLAWERQNIFSGWICVGRAEDVPDNRTMKAFDIGESGVLVVRGDDGKLRAFENACRHRGHELLPCGGTASPRVIMCPYHAWTYDLDGSLMRAPGFQSHGDFDKSEFGLFAMPVEEWHGWLFVDPSRSAGAFADHVGELEEIVTRYDGAHLRTPVTHTYDVAANWKVIVENYQECYHCAMIHPELCRVSPPESGDNVELHGDWVGGWMELRESAQTMSLTGKSGGVAIQGLSEQELRTVMYLVGYPNLLVSLHPDYVMTHLMTPLAADRTHVECAWAFPKDVAARPDFDPSYAVDFWDLTNRQDWGACESVQRGLTSPHARPGPLAPDEDGVYQFVTRVAKAYAGSADPAQAPH